MGAISNFRQILKTKTRHLLIHCPPKSNPNPNPKENQRKSHPENADNQPPRMTMKMIIQNKTKFLPMIQTHQTHQTLQTQTVMQMQEKKTILPVVVVRVSEKKPTVLLPVTWEVHQILEKNREHRETIQGRVVMLQEKEHRRQG